MRRTLIVVLLVAIAVSMVSPARAGDLNWSAGVTLTEEGQAIQIGSRIEATRGRHLIGCWFSSSGQLPVMVQGLNYGAFGDFPGLHNVQEVVLSPDHGKTVWSAKLVEGKGYYVLIPNLPAGAYGLEWGVVSKDKRNRLILIIIPINWSSRRATAATNHAMVQHAPPGCEGFSDQQWFACLRGFVPAWATPDPAYAALLQVSQPLATQPAVAPSVLEPPRPIRVEPNFDGEAKLVLDFDGGPAVFPVSIIARIEVGDTMIFRRDGEFVAEVEVMRVVPGRLIEARIVHGGGVRPNDDIFTKKETR